MDAPTGEFVDHRIGYTTANGAPPSHPHLMLHQPVPQHQGQRYSDSYSPNYYQNHHSATGSPAVGHPDYNTSYQVPVVSASHDDLGRKVEPATIPQEVNMYALGPGPPAPHQPSAPPSAGYSVSTTMPPTNGYGGRPPYPPALNNSHATTPIPMGPSGVSAAPQPAPPPPPPPGAQADYGTVFGTLKPVLDGLLAQQKTSTDSDGRDQLPEELVPTLLGYATDSLRILDPAVAEKMQRDHAASLKEDEEAFQKELEEKVKEARAALEAERQASLPAIEEESDAGDDANGMKRKRMRRDDKGASNEPQHCQTCGVRSSPEWRRGPLGPRTLCNACGLVWIKIMKRRANGLPDEDEEEGEDNNDEGQSPGNSD